MVNWKFNIGDTISDSKRDIVIVNRETRYMSTWKKPCNEKWCQYKCNKCGYIGWTSEKSLSEGKGCLGCNGKIVVRGINDIATTDPYIISYLLNPEDAYKYKRRSGQIIKTKCPFCGDIRDYKISQLLTEPYACHRCGKNTSIPEKFFCEFLKMYDIDYIFQLSSANMKWCKNYRYDFYIASINTIVELHGKQHYEHGIYNRSYEEIHEADISKYNLAMLNGIERYYQIPVVRSTKEFLINKIMKHELIDLLQIDKINLKENLEECYKRILSKRSINICEFYNKHPNYSAVQIGKIFGVTSPTVLKALWDGTKNGICNYNGQDKLKETRINNNRLVSKPVEIINMNGEIFRFESIREAERMSKKILGIHITRFFIKKCCNNNQLYQGYEIRYLQ